MNTPKFIVEAGDVVTLHPAEILQSLLSGGDPETNKARAAALGGMKVEVTEIYGWHPEHGRAFRWHTLLSIPENIKGLILTEEYIDMAASYPQLHLAATQAQGKLTKTITIDKCNDCPFFLFDGDEEEQWGKAWCQKRNVELTGDYAGEIDKNCDLP